MDDEFEEGVFADGSDDAYSRDAGQRVNQESLAWLDFDESDAGHDEAETGLEDELFVEQGEAFDQEGPYLEDAIIEDEFEAPFEDEYDDDYGHDYSDDYEDEFEAEFDMERDSDALDLYDIEDRYAPGAWGESEEREGPYDYEHEQSSEALFSMLFESERPSHIDDVTEIANFAWGPTLRRGSRGGAVRTLQRLLNIAGANLTVDGVFGRQTQSAVRSFQSANGLSVDGIVGSQTKAALTEGRAAQGPALPPSSAGAANAPATSSTPSDLPDRIVNEAMREWRRWARGGRRMTEREPAARPIVQEYWRVGGGRSVSLSDLASASWQSDNPWSAAFISYCMREAGAGSAFRYAWAHWKYVAKGKRNRLTNNRSTPFWTYRTTEAPVMLGDLVCNERSGSGVTYDNVDSGRGFKSHCDIVVEINGNTAKVVGGNKRHSVREKTVRLRPDGTLDTSGDQSEYYAIVRCRGDVNSSSSGSPMQSNTGYGDDVEDGLGATVTAGAGVSLGADGLPQLGKVQLFTRGRVVGEYQFTPEDRLWTARLVIGEAGGRDTTENRAVIQCVINRYAIQFHRRFRSFAGFLQVFSTTLQPVLRNRGAARRHMNSRHFVRTGGYYPTPRNGSGPRVPRGQLRRHLELQRKPWDELSSTAQRLAAGFLSGEISYTGIGNADNFASTLIYFRSRNGRRPRNHEEWRSYTEQVGRRHGRWIGDVPGLDQMKNAFFLSNQAARLAEGAVRVRPAG
ncbi:MAG: DUF2272 domain-containing protein [Pseudomonadota bacterium]